jgi:murein DD-endopeptidase MepM/ murein hydrolase activator NlpD
MWKTRRVDVSDLDDDHDRDGRGDSRRRTGRHVFDIAHLDTDHHDPFDDEQPHKSRWLVTTCVAGIAGGLVIGGALFGTFGLDQSFGSLGRRAVDWQQTDTDDKGDRIYGTFEGSSMVSRRDIADIVAERPYMRITVAFDRVETSGEPSVRSALLASTGLIGSLAPDYPDAEQPLFVRPGVLDGDAGYFNSTTINKSFVTADTLPYEETLVLGDGETIMGVLLAKGTVKARAAKLIRALDAIYPTEQVAAGTEIALTVQLSKDLNGNDIIVPIRLAFVPSDNREILVEMNEDGQYLSRAVDDDSDELRIARHRSTARIRKSLYLAAKEQGVPESIIVEMMRIHGYDVDFQREVRPGDSFEVFYGAPSAEEERAGDRDVVLFSSLTLSEQPRGYYRFTTPDDGITDYYDETGRSATKFLMRTPINGARISSSFGMRRHPILGYNKLHTGVDFAAAYGTPIKAAGDGIIEQIGRVGAYGKYIRIRHANSYQTAYAHMSRFASGLEVGSRVRQGQVIGFVGSTGRSTGAHLHYEVLVGGEQVDPMRLEMPTGRQLGGEYLAQFNQERERILSLMAQAPAQTQVAQANQ